MNKKSLSINIFLVFIIAFVICIYFGKGVFSDPDVGWHLKAGELIWKTHSIPYNDPLTFTADQEWYNLSWSWDVVVYWIFYAFGAMGLFYFQALLFAVLIMALYKFTLYFREFSGDTRAVITAISGLLIWDVLYLRPQLLAYFLAASVLLLLIKWRRQSIYLVPIIVLLWANVHGSFIAVYTILFAFILEAWHEKDYSWLKTLILTSAFSSIALFINPLGYKIILGVARTLDSAITMYISEWMPFTFGTEYAATMVIIILLMAGGFTNDKIPVSYRILAFLWLLAALGSKRSFGFFGVLALPYLGYALNPILQKSPSKFHLTTSVKLLLIIIFLILAALSPILKSNIPYFKEKDLEYSKKAPLEAIKFLNKSCNNAKIFNDYNIGGYLALYIDPNIKYFIDGRAGTVFSEKFIKQYLSGVIGSSDIEGLLTEHPVDAALISNELTERDSYHKYFANWNKIYKDDRVTMYTNRGSKTCKGLKH